MDEWESTPRLAFLSPEPGSGKTRALEISETLVPRPDRVGQRDAGLSVSQGERRGRATNDTLRRDRHAVRAEGEGQRGGARAASMPAIARAPPPGAAWSRQDHRDGGVRRPTAPSPWLVSATCRTPSSAGPSSSGCGGARRTNTSSRIARGFTSPEGAEIRDHLVRWAVSLHGIGEGYPVMPDGITDRDADVWEPLLAVADAAGGEWPERARVAAVALVALAHGDTQPWEYGLSRPADGVWDRRRNVHRQPSLSTFASSMRLRGGTSRVKPLTAAGWLARL